MLDIFRSDGGGEDLAQGLLARDQEIADLKEHIRALQEADQRDFLNDNSDQLAVIIQAKNKVIQELQSQLQASGKEVSAQAWDSAAVSAAEVERLTCSLSELQVQLDTREEQLRVAVADRNGLQAKLDADQVQGQVEERDEKIRQLEMRVHICSAENERLAEQVAASAAAHAMEMARSQASAKAAEARAESLMHQEAVASPELLAREASVAQREARLQQAEAPPPPGEQPPDGTWAAQRDELEGKVSMLTETMMQLTDSLEKANLDADGLRSVNRGLEGQLKDHRAIIARGEDRIKALVAETERLSDSLEAQTSLATTSTRPSARPEELVEAKRALQESEVKLAHVCDQLSRCRSEVTALRRDRERQADPSEACAKQLSFPEHLGGGGVQSLIAGVLQDVEAGGRGGVTIYDLGVQDITGIGTVDKFLQLVAALMAVRADVRFGVFGAWALCHLIYVLYLVWEHLPRR